ncbi:hypothetical protein [Dendronalium sp. ChiSLP03b]|uniref:hypothetical protein n=1 Tax=Dendronalium sp. ChiSLP03b TaxID=3075381 RepID=UPI002AD33B92|nr:hypothetical protein [Dendronalium sp. ChiSLP03b]MDZ8206586.1 hypothetical protein [Dendronalium sp. ChiSLP03b]
MNIPPRKRKKATSAASYAPKPPKHSAKKDTAQQENLASVTITVTAVEVEDLSEEEQSLRLHLEQKVERAFYEAGKALMELRDCRLYRSTHKTFEDYCRERFGYSRRQPYLLMEAAVIFDNLTEKCDQIDHILPTSEGQVRPLTKLEPQQQQQAWQLSVQEASGKVPTGRIVKDVVQRFMEYKKVPNNYEIGEVCQIIAQDNPELRGKSGCWAIVSQVNDFTCTVRLWDGEYTIGLKHLKSYGYSPLGCQQIQQISDRISKIYSSTLEESVQRFLESLGKLNRPYLTVLEEKLLNVLDSGIGIGTI